ncbi:hypothetical protein DICSQDRAFT_52811 [Dichomitus squalens LYAD-421 SS1]|uniref:uncharacterized protein n=1 Tax=Dichomitus squalens (strain LYAD-421) TaxID=732165 RepID=UPI00044128DC|nr:uncharacterized protein DICSQDRAFT_52811 [Dichomitus squalens LYAD-421 SS1]EJF64901.1 hypothetical protein DICSQDRAFT_52811 [Dichomitus squalens LYAD-421 SS1]
MLYSRPSFVPHSAKIIVGIPPKRRSAAHKHRRALSLTVLWYPDVLNRFYPAWRSSAEAGTGVGIDPDPRRQMEHARHLAKHVFPGEYGLRSAFCTGPLGKHASSRTPDGAHREQEIKNKGPCKTPKRLKHVLDPLEKMVWRHRKCKYKMLLDMACPSKVRRACRP